MQVLIVTPAVGDTQTGNRRTADQWARQLAALGHAVTVVHRYSGEPADALIALNASRSHAAIAAFHRAHATCPIGVVLTGSDIYPEPDGNTLASLRLADRVVGLQSRAVDRVPPEYRDRFKTIVQAVDFARPGPEPRSSDSFDVAVVAHLRHAKDPLRAAAAARLLPKASRLRVRLAGDILEPGYRDRVEREQTENDRFVWLGELDTDATIRLIAGSDLLVVSSLFEGGARVIGESIVIGTPVIVARMDAACALLGDDYPGLYEAGNTGQLAAMMNRAETEHDYLELLRRCARSRSAQFDPRNERAALRELMSDFDALRREKS